MNDIRICRGDSVTLTASGGTNYQWSGGASGSDSSITVSPFTTSTYYLNAVNFCGSLMDTVTIHVEFQPIQLLSQDTTICAGQSFVLNAIGASAYQWFGGINSTDQTITVFPLVSTSYFLKAVNNCSQLTDTVTVTVNNLPILLNIHDTTICIGKSVTLTATGGTVYQWSGGINSTDSSVTVSPSTNTIYYLHATNSCTALSDSINIHVGITPIVAHLTDTTVCEGQSVTFSVTGATNCQWSGGIISNANHLTVLPSSTTTYYLNATNQCNQLEDTITITVHNLPQVTVSGNVNICNGKSTLLTASGGKTYQWFEGSSEVTPSITVSPVITTNYSVKTFDGLCYSQITTVTVTVNPRPIVSIFGKDTICAGETGIFQAIIKDGVPPYQYKWTNGSTSSSSLFTFLTNASISVTVVDKNGCSDSSHLAISVSPQPNALLTGSISGCSPLEVEFSNQSEYAKTYYWLLGDGTISQLKNPKHTYKKPGTYTVTLIAQNNHCADTLTINDYVSVWQKPHASISYSTKNDRDFEIFNNSSFADSCILLFGDGNLLTQCDWKKTSHSYAEDGTYDLTQFVSTLKGCIDSTTIKILAQTEGTLFYPNSFTPNNDGENDIFYAYGFNIKKFNMSIYDRWGQLIFQSDDVYKGWDGTYKGRPVEQDVYVLKINYEVKKARLKTIYDHISVIK
jgi:gliding motility-associated-like protein